MTVRRAMISALAALPMLFSACGGASNETPTEASSDASPAATATAATRPMAPPAGTTTTALPADASESTGQQTTNVPPPSERTRQRAVFEMNAACARARGGAQVPPPDSNDPRPYARASLARLSRTLEELARIRVPRALRTQVDLLRQALSSLQPLYLRAIDTRDPSDRKRLASLLARAEAGVAAAAASVGTAACAPGP